MKSSTLISIFVLIFSFSFLVAAAGVEAGSQKEAKKSLAAILNLHATSLLEQKTPSRSEAASESKSLEEVCIALGQDLDAFVDFKSPYPQAIRTKNYHSDVRAVIGFHFPLQ